MKILLVFVLLLAGCAPSSLEDFRCEGEAHARKLAADLKAVEKKEDLLRIFPKVRKRLSKIAGLLLQVREFQEKNQLFVSDAESSLASEELFVQIARLYEIPGAREVFENAQGEAIRRLSQKNH